VFRQPDRQTFVDIHFYNPELDERGAVCCSSDVSYYSYALLTATIIYAMTDLLDRASDRTDSKAAASIDWNKVLPAIY